MQHRLVYSSSKFPRKPGEPCTCKQWTPGAPLWFYCAHVNQASHTYAHKSLHFSSGDKPYAQGQSAWNEAWKKIRCQVVAVPPWLPSCTASNDTYCMWLWSYELWVFLSDATMICCDVVYMCVGCSYELVDAIIVKVKWKHLWCWCLSCAA